MSEKKNEIVTQLEMAEVETFGKRDVNTYHRLMNQIEKGFTKASEAYVMIACNIWQIYHNEYYRIDKFKSIADFALEKYEFKKSTTHNYIRVIEKFGEIEDGKALGLKEEYKPFKCSQLINMLSFTPEQLEGVDPAWSVRQIIEYGREGIPVTDIEDPDDESDAAGIEEFSVSDYLDAPEINSGRTLLAEIKDLSEIEKIKETLMNAYTDMCRDKNFAGKNIRFAIELVFD